MKWTEADVPDQTGRVAVITGANTGIGLETATVLAGKGAHVVMAVRDLDKGKDAASHIATGNPSAQVTLQRLDLSSLTSVRAAADELKAAHPQIDLLINNAGVMFTPEGVTPDGVEFQFGTNHLGHYALTGLLLDTMLPVQGSRVVTVSSLAHRVRASTNFDDVQRPYDRVAAYGRSKVANLLFTYELQRRLAAHGSTTIALGCHPGGAATELARDAGVLMKLFQPAADLFMQSAAMGALPTLRAATDPEARGGQYYGPDGLSGMRGHPVTVHSSAYSHRLDVAAQLWAVSEELTGVSFLD